MSNKDKAIDLGVLADTPETIRNAIKNGTPIGKFSQILYEEFPAYDQPTGDSYVWRGNNNADIVIGRDRNAGYSSGYAGRGMTQCGAIDLVVGRLSSVQNSHKAFPGISRREMADKIKRNPARSSGIETGPNFAADAARVYITQKSEDIDQYFGLKPSRGPSPQMKSAIATKADQIRVIGREKVKIYCGQGTFEGFEPGIGETNSLGQRLTNQVIELQVGSLESHPLVLGNKLVKYLKKQNENQRRIHKALFNIQSNLTALNTAVAILTAGAPPFSVMTKDSILGIAESVTESINTFVGDLNALDNELIPGQDYILSQTVFTT